MAALLCCTTIFAFADAGPICDALLGNADATSGADVPARVKWTTDADGNVDITILPFSKAEETTDKPTAWRGRGVADDLTAAKGWEMTIDGVAVLVEDYFEKNYAQNSKQAQAPNVYQLKIKDGKKAELAGKTVVIKKTTTGSNICWWTPRGNNAYGKAEFEYLYGAECVEVTLGTPTNVSITGNILTFDAVTGADAYAANIYFNGEVIKSITVTSGVELTRLMNTGATFEVKVVAKSGAVESEESAAATWVVADEPLTIGSSEYCDFVIGNNDNERAAMTWQTDAEGNINITISGDGATWRSTAFKGTTYFWVGECPASAFFAEEYTQGSAVYTLKLKDATKKPVVGETIQFKGTYQWKTTNATNAYQNVTFTYTYGSACAGLAAPTNVSVDANGVITFDAVDGADNYVVTIYNNDLPVAIYKSIAPGATLPFQAIETGTYTVTVYAQGDGAIDSDESAPFEWVLTGSGYSTSQSSLCDVLFESVADPGGNYLIEDSYVELSMYTNTDNKSIIVSISPVIEGDEVSFREVGVELSAFTTNGVALSSYFTANNPNNQKTYTLTPKDGCSLPYGTVIHYNGTIRWNTSKHKNAYRNNVAIEYIYGSNCDQKTVSAGVNNSAMGSAVVKNGDEIVSYVPENTEVSFIATPADAQLHRFVNWTQGGVVVSTDATYTTTIDKSTNLIANFEYILYDYCRYPIVATGGAATGKKLYLSLGKKNNGEYFIRFDGSSEAPLTALNTAAYTLNSVKTEIIFEEDNFTGNNVPFNTTNGRWSFDAAGYGSAQMVFTLAEGKTTQDIYVWANTITFSTTEGDLVYVDNQYRNKLFGNPSPLRYNINWDCTTCVDTEAPILNTFHVDVLNETDLRIATQATDNWDVPLTYTISREGAEDIVLIGASGETLTYDITGLTTGTEYSFTMVVSDGINSATQTCTATPLRDTEKPVMNNATLVSNDYTSAIISVSATDNKRVVEYHVVDLVNGIDMVLIDTEGQIIINGLSDNTTYNFTITAKDAAGNESDGIIISLIIPFNTDANLALNKPYGFGYENANNIAKNANDGDVTTQWTTYANRPVEEEWWYVDLENVYELRNITIAWGDPAPTKYILQTRVYEPNEEEKANDAAWVTIATITDAANRADQSTDVNCVGRYVRFHSLAKTGNCIRMNEFRVYGKGVLAASDNEKPVMTGATLVSFDSKNVVISASATDNIGIATYRVVDTANNINMIFNAENGDMKITGLNSGTEYNFTITAIDLFGNESANDETINVTTSSYYSQKPEIAAPTPNWPAEKVMSLYSDVYEFAPETFTTYNATWHNRPTMTREKIDTDEYLYYNLHQDGVIGWVFANTSVVTMEKLHIDIWASVDGSIGIRPITGGDEVRKILTLVAGQWNSFDIDLAEFGTQNWNNVFQFGIDQYNAGGLVGEFIAIDNVYFYRETAANTLVTLNDAENNSTKFYTYAKQLVDVQLTRSFPLTTEWYTLCLPFDMDANQLTETFGAGYTLATLNSSEDRGSIIHLNFDYLTELQAGVPYLFKPGVATATIPTIQGVTIKNVDTEALEVQSTHMHFQGTFNPITLTEANQRFVGSANYVYSPAEGGTAMGAFRCYFTIPVESQAQVGSKAARIVFGPQVATGTENVQSDQASSAKVIIDGTLYIIRDGRTYNAQGQLVK